MNSLAVSFVENSRLVLVVFLTAVVVVSAFTSKIFVEPFERRNVGVVPFTCNA